MNLVNPDDLYIIFDEKGLPHICITVSINNNKIDRVIYLGLFDKYICTESDYDNIISKISFKDALNEYNLTQKYSNLLSEEKIEEDKVFHIWNRLKNAIMIRSFENELKLIKEELSLYSNIDNNHKIKTKRNMHFSKKTSN